MTPAQLTAPEALREVARRLAQARGGNHLRMYPFLCNRTKDLLREGRITEEVCSRIVSRIVFHLPPDRGVAYESDDEGRDPVEPRILAALWLAHELEDEDLAA